MVAHEHNLDDLIDTLNNELCALNAWLLCNKLTLNTKKTYYMVFHRTQLKISIDISTNSINNRNHQHNINIIIIC